MMKAWFKSVLPRLGAAYVDTAVVVYGSDFTGWPDRDAGLPGGTAHLSSRDARWVEKLMAKTRRSPTGRAALDWAAAHDIRFEVSNRKNVTSAYNPGTGNIELHRGILTQADPGLLVHEIRHAWQDRHGLIPDNSVANALRNDLARRLIIQALYEADAYAHQELVSYELRHRGNRPKDLGRTLMKSFMGWFPHRARYYQRYEMQRVALGERLQKIDEVLGREKKDIPADIFHSGLDPWRRSDLELLGRSFAGVNYLSRLSQKERDHLRRRVLTPATALAAFNLKAKRAAWSGKENDMRKAQLRARLQTPLKRLPLPG